MNDRIHADNLKAEARRALKESGRSQTSVAEELGKTRGAVWQALNEEAAPMQDICVRIIEVCRGVELEGPFFAPKHGGE